MKTEKEIREMIQKLWKMEARAPNWEKESFSNASEVLEWVLEERPEEEVILFE